MISEKIIKGRQCPEKGFPTANINTEISKGVYFCETNYGNGLGICIRENELEVHLIGFSGDIYGKKLEITEIKEIDKKLLLNIALIIN